MFTRYSAFAWVEIARAIATRPHLMQRPDLLPNTSNWEQLRSMEFVMAETLCTNVLITNVLIP